MALEHCGIYGALLQSITPIDSGVCKLLCESVRSHITFHGDETIFQTVLVLPESTE